MIELNRIYNDDCLNLMKEIDSKSIDLICCDLPYGNGITGCNWDYELPFKDLWKNYNRIIKDNGVICLFSKQPFTSDLIQSNREMFRYCWYWEKEQGSNFQLAKVQPLSVIEDICIFSKAKAANGANELMNYYPIMEKRNSPVKSGGKPSTSDILHQNNMIALNKIYTESYPKNILRFNRVHSSKRIHPTEKPIELLEYLIKTYTKENEIVLDNCSGSGSLAIACNHINRNFICIEKNKEYYEKSIERLKQENMKRKLF